MCIIAVGDWIEMQLNGMEKEPFMNHLKVKFKPSKRSVMVKKNHCSAIRVKSRLNDDNVRYTFPTVHYS